jgi:hypothetical protein
MFEPSPRPSPLPPTVMIRKFLARAASITAGEQS